MFKYYTFTQLIISLLAILIGSPAVAQERGIVPVPIKDKSGNQVLLYQESHALLVGVSEYTAGWSNLPGVRNDLDEVRTTLEQKGFNTVVVRNPTRVELRDAIEEFINQYGQNIDNRLIFYFAGHGHTMKASYGEEMGYFVPSDAPNPNIDKSGFLARSIDMQSIEVYSKQVQSKHALFLFDSCFSGSIFSLSRAIPENISFKTSKPVRQFITAGSADETVPDESIFNDQLIRALNGEGDLDGDGYLTGVELGEFLNKTVINYSKGSQHPQYGKIRNPNLDKGDFVFSLLDGRHVKQSIDSIVQKRKELEQKRLNLEEEGKRIAALQRMQEEKKKLEDEERRLKEAQEDLARLSPSFDKKFPVKPGSKKVQITTKTAPLRVRAVPSSKAEVVAELPAHSILPMIQETGLWYQIEYLPGKKGWITKKYSRLLDSPLKAESVGKCPEKMSFIPGGEFLVGGVDSLKGMSLSAFCMDKYEVTQAEFEMVMRNNPSSSKGESLPVEKVTWFEADEYCRKVSKRLPTEVEWEKAANEGKGEIFPLGDEFGDDKANFCDSNCQFDWKRNKSDDGYATTAPVGSYAPNSYGLHDMAGNVWEWVADWYDGDYYKTASRRNFQGPSSGTQKVLRGGSWIVNSRNLLSTPRRKGMPSSRYYDSGFRCAQ